MPFHSRAAASPTGARWSSEKLTTRPACCSVSVSRQDAVPAHPKRQFQHARLPGRRCRSPAVPASCNPARDCRNARHCFPSGRATAIRRGWPAARNTTRPASHLPNALRSRRSPTARRARWATSAAALRRAPVIGTKCVGSRDSSTSLPSCLDQRAQQLLIALAQRNHHPPAFSQLIDQRLRHLLRRTGDDDLVERRMLGPAAKAVAHPRLECCGSSAARKPPWPARPACELISIV